MLNTREKFRITMEDLESNIDHMLEFVKARLVLYQIEYGVKGYEVLLDDIDKLCMELE